MWTRLPVPREIKSGRQRNNVQTAGQGQPTFLFAHGFGCDQSMWRHVARRFEDRGRVVVFDHVGAGGSDVAAYDGTKYASLGGYATDVIEICEDLGLRDVIFVGHSVSATIGVHGTRPAPSARRL